MRSACRPWDSDLDIVKKVVLTQPELFVVDSHLRTPVHVAAYMGKHEVFGYLISLSESPMQLELEVCYPLGTQSLRVRHPLGTHAQHRRSTVPHHVSLNARRVLVERLLCRGPSVLDDTSRPIMPHHNPPCRTTRGGRRLRSWRATTPS